MTDERLYELLSNIKNEISAEEYPEIIECVYDNIGDEAGEVYDTPFYIASELLEADATKLLPKCVADLLVEIYEEETENGNYDAACSLGSLYYTGRIGEQNFKKALEYYKIAAKGGSRLAQENLGYCYYYGRSTDVDYEKAFNFFAIGAFDGHIISLYKIGDMYRNGYYVEKNERETFLIYSRCLETMTEESVCYAGADVFMRMGDCYFNGIGTEPDLKLALKYYQNSEQLYIERLNTGDFFIRKCYEKVIARQAEIRERLKASMPAYEWTE